MTAKGFASTEDPAEKKVSFDQRPPSATVKCGPRCRGDDGFADA